MEESNKAFLGHSIHENRFGKSERPDRGTPSVSDNVSIKIVPDIHISHEESRAAPNTNINDKSINILPKKQ